MSIAEQHNFKNIAGVGVGYLAFDSLEVLCSCAAEIRPHVDKIVVALQDISYNGDKISQADVLLAEALRDDYHLIDDIIYINPSDFPATAEPRLVETGRRNKLIEYLHDKHGCSHVMIQDADEYIDGGMLLSALKEIDENDYEITYCKYQNFYADTMHYLKYPFKVGMYVPLFAKHCYRFKFETLDFDKPSDPTRRYERPGKVFCEKLVNGQRIQIKTKTDDKGNVIEDGHEVQYHIFDWSTVHMCHLSWCRANARKKLRGWSSRSCFRQQALDLEDQAVYDWEEFMKGNNASGKARIMFNTPDHSVDIVRLDREYLRLKYDWRECLPRVYDRKSILILAVTTDKPLFNAQERAIRETWGSKEWLEDYPNVRVMFIKEKPDLDVPVRVDWASGTISVRNDGSLAKTPTKMADAYNYITNKTDLDFDYVLKTNTSTYINIPLLDLFAGYLDCDAANYCGEAFVAHWTGGYFSPGGNFCLSPRRNWDLLFKEGDWRKKILEQESRGIYDDAAWGALYNGRLLKLGVAPESHLHTVGIFHNMGKPYIGESLASYMAVQVKDFSKPEMDLAAREQKEIDDLHAIHDVMRSVEDFGPMLDKLREDHWDADYYINRHSYREWFNPAENIEKLKFDQYDKCARDEGIEKQKIYFERYLREISDK